MSVYYQDKFATLYHGDCREILPSLTFESVITDPVWPNASVPLIGSDDPFTLLHDALELSAGAQRVAIQIGCDSDPRFLYSVPRYWKFFRVAWLELARPHYKGRLMYGSDVAYLFGSPPLSKQGARVIPGRFIDADSKGKHSNHPCPRKLNHVAWLVRWWTEETDIVCDPFCGSGTTLVAAKYAGRKSIGCEVEERFCEMTANWLRQIMDFA
jgi:site-specific DNA-methyltransferase (adenine-specific)